jgi:hypothetical protein
MPHPSFSGITFTLGRQRMLCQEEAKQFQDLQDQEREDLMKALDQRDQVLIEEMRKIATEVPATHNTVNITTTTNTGFIGSNLSGPVHFGKPL